MSRVRTRYTALENKVKKDRKTYEDCNSKAERFQDDIENELADYRSIDAQQRRAEREVEKQRARLEEMQAEEADFPSMEQVESAIHQAQSELRLTKTKLDAAKKAVGSLMEKIEQEEQKKVDSSQRLERIMDEKTLRRNRLFSKFPNVQVAFEFIDHNRKLFRRPVCGPVGKEFRSLISMRISLKTLLLTFVAFVSFF